jgi:hypothetical protein
MKVVWEKTALKGRDSVPPFDAYVSAALAAEGI